MKKIFQFMVMCAMVACTKQEAGNIIPGTGTAQDSSADEKVTLQIGLPSVRTRLPGEAQQDESVKDLQVFVFDVNSSRLDAYVHDASAAGAVKVNCKKGRKHVYALVNAPSLKTVETEADLLAQTAVLTSNSVGRLIMTGCDKSLDLAADRSVVIPVTKLVARVSLVSFTNNINIEQYKGKKLVVKAVYLLNAFGNAKYFEGSPAQHYYNFKEPDLQPEALLYDQVPSEEVALGQHLKGKYHYYTFPNPAETDHSDESDLGRFTRLVVEATFDGTPCYYPVTIPSLSANHKYEVKIVVNRPGSSSPDIPVSIFNADISIDVLPWNDGGLIEETI